METTPACKCEGSEEQVMTHDEGEFMTLQCPICLWWTTTTDASGGAMRSLPVHSVGGE